MKVGGAKVGQGLMMRGQKLGAMFGSRETLLNVEFPGIRAAVAGTP